MATSGTVLNDFVSQNAVIILVTGVLATIIALIAYYVARMYLPSNISESVTVNPDEQDKNSVSPESAANEHPQTDVKEGPESGDSGEQPAIDPVYYCEHIQGEIKKVKQSVTARKICEALSEEQIAEERQRQHDQLAEIFRLMQQQEDKFGISSMDEMQEQMRLYADIK